MQKSETALQNSGNTGKCCMGANLSDITGKTKRAFQKRPICQKYLFGFPEIQHSFFG